MLYLIVQRIRSESSSSIGDKYDILGEDAMPTPKTRSQRLASETLALSNISERNPDGTTKWPGQAKDPMNELQAWIMLTHQINLDEARTTADQFNKRRLADDELIGRS